MEEGQKASEAQLRAATAEMARLPIEEYLAPARIALDSGSMSMAESLVRNALGVLACLPLLLAGWPREPLQSGATAERTASKVRNQNQSRLAQ